MNKIFVFFNILVMVLLAGCMGEKEEVNNNSKTSEALISNFETYSKDTKRVVTSTPTSILEGLFVESSGEKIIYPSDDSSVRAGKYTNKNFGNEKILVTKASPNMDYRQESYIKFNLMDISSITKAILRLNVSKGIGYKGSVSAIDKDNWSETTITYTNKPVEGSKITDFLVSKTLIEIDLTNYIKAEKAKDGIASIKLKCVTPDTTGQEMMYYLSKEAGYQEAAPQLVINGTSSGEIVPDTFKLTVNSMPSTWGGVTITPIKSSYTSGEAVTFVPKANTGYRFKNWSGTNSKEVIGNKIIMNGNKTVIAQFEVEPQTTTGNVITVTNLKQLKDTVYSTKSGDKTVLIEDGEYILDEGLWITGNNIVFKSKSGNRDKVIIRGAFKASRIFFLAGDNITVQDMTLGEVNNHAIQVHSELDADGAIIRNIRIFNCKEQMIKGSGAKTPTYSDNCIVENCLFEFTEGKAYQYYTGGIDVHMGKNWIVRNNIFKNIRNPDGGLTEGAVHFWSNSENTLIENNIIINCDRGILLGMDNVYHYNGIIRNNFIQVERDTGIYLCYAVNTQVYNNTVYISSVYPNAIEYRFAQSTDNKIYNNLTNKPITSRNSGVADLKNNVTTALESWFISAKAGDLHLAMDISSVMDKSIDIDSVAKDIDGDLREKLKSDIGADEKRISANTRITEIKLEASKNSVVANGVDKVVFTLKGLYSDGTEKIIGADSYISTNISGVTKILSANVFQAYNTGIYTIESKYGTITSNAIKITVVSEGLNDKLPEIQEIWHNRGQTFITWKEINTILPGNDINYDVYFNAKKNYPRKIKYNIYTSTAKITDITGLKPIATINALSAWNDSYYGTGMIYGEANAKKAIRYKLKDNGDYVENGIGFYAYSANQAGSKYYAVTSVVDGVENKKISLANSSSVATAEIAGAGVPVLQRVEKPASFQYINGATLYYYVRWESGENSAINGKALDYLVAVPQNVKYPSPVGIHMHCWGGNIDSGYGWWSNAEKGAILVATNQEPYDWWTGYNEKLVQDDDYLAYPINPPKTQQEWESGRVKPYTTNRIRSFIDWMNKNSDWKVDYSRIFTAGSSMGGSGSIMMAIRYPELVAWCRSWVGVHIPELSPSFAKSYSYMYGPKEYNVLFEDGTKVWDYYNDVYYLKKYPKKEIGFIAFSNGKNDAAIGWKQAVDFVKALQETKRPFLFIWGQQGHGQRTVMPKNGSERVLDIDIRTNQIIPAYNKCTLDNIIGTGETTDGDSAGQINRWLYWDTVDLIDTSEKIELTSALMEAAPASDCKVSVTPRRVQNFKPASGTVVKWKNIDLVTGAQLETGETLVDENGLITVENITVKKGKSKLVISK